MSGLRNGESKNFQFLNSKIPEFSIFDLKGPPSVEERAKDHA
jgi:hypothetical protein